MGGCQNSRGKKALRRCTYGSTLLALQRGGRVGGGPIPRKKSLRNVSVKWPLMRYGLGAESTKYCCNDQF